MYKILTANPVIYGLAFWRSLQAKTSIITSLLLTGIIILGGCSASKQVTPR